VILLLGKGPHQATLEVAIYQALYFDFDLSTASILSIFYIALGGSFLLSLCFKAEEPAAYMVSTPPKRQDKHAHQTRDFLTVLMAGIVFPP